MSEQENNTYEQESKIDSLKSWGDTHVPHISTTVRYLEGKSKEDLKEGMLASLKETRKSIKEWEKQNTSFEYNGVIRQENLPMT